MPRFKSISDGLDGAVLHSLRRHLDRPPLAADELKQRVEAHRATLRRIAAEHPLLDLDMAERLADSLIHLIEATRDVDFTYAQDLVQGAVLFFVESPDHDDVDSGFSLDGDERVVGAVESVVLAL